MTSISSTSSKPSAPPSGLTGVLFALLVGKPDPKTPCLFVGVAKTFGLGEGEETSGVARRGDDIVFCRFAEGRGLKSAGSPPAVGGENGRNRFFAAARRASWDSGVVSPSSGILLVPVLGGEEDGRAFTRMGVSFDAPGRFLEVEGTARGVVNAWSNPAVRVTSTHRLRSG